MSPDKDLELRQQLRDVGQRRTDAIERQRQATAELAVLVRRAHQHAVPITTIAEDSGLSRPAIYTMLKSGG